MPYALLTVKKTGTTFWVQPNEAFNSTGNWLSWMNFIPWTVDNQYCLVSDGVEPFKEQWDKEVICNLVLGNQNKNIEDVAGEQWAIGMAAGCSAFFWLIFLMYIIDRERNAKALAEEVARISQCVR